MKLTLTGILLNMKHSFSVMQFQLHLFKEHIRTYIECEVLSLLLLTKYTCFSIMRFSLCTAVLQSYDYATLMLIVFTLHYKGNHLILIISFYIC